MSPYEELVSSLMLTLGAIAVVAVLVGITILAYRVWRLSQSLRGRLGRSIAWFIYWPVVGACTTGIRIGRFVAGLFETIIVRPLQAFGDFLSEFAHGDGPILCFVCVCALVVFLLPFGMLSLAGWSLWRVLGVMAAGGIIGVLCAPFVGWRLRVCGLCRAVGASLLTVVGGAYAASCLVAFLVAMTFD